MFSFDLKSAYLQVTMKKNYWPFLGFAIQVPTHSGVIERFFCYKMLPFGLNDAARVLTKVLHAPIKHWRACRGFPSLYTLMTVSLLPVLEIWLCKILLQ